MRRNLESLSLRLRSRCLRTATAFVFKEMEVSNGFLGKKSADEREEWEYCTWNGEEKVAYLLDQHVQVLGDLWCEACKAKESLRQS